MNKTLTNCAPLIKTQQFDEIKYCRTSFRHIYIYPKHIFDMFPKSLSYLVQYLKYTPFVGLNP